MTTDPQVLDGTITIPDLDPSKAHDFTLRGNGTLDTDTDIFRPLSATELLADPPLTPADRARIAGLAVVLVFLLVSVVAGMWLLAPDGWLS